MAAWRLDISSNTFLNNHLDRKPSSVLTSCHGLHNTKKARSVEDALDLLRKEKGKHFDPELVDLFIAQLPAVLEIMNLYAEKTET
jgi:hypothetical protein